MNTQSKSADGESPHVSLPTPEPQSNDAHARFFQEYPASTAFWLALTHDIYDATIPADSDPEDILHVDADEFTTMFYRRLRQYETAKSQAAQREKALVALRYIQGWLENGNPANGSRAYTELMAAIKLLEGEAP